MDNERSLVAFECAGCQVLFVGGGSRVGLFRTDSLVFPFADDAQEVTRLEHVMVNSYLTQDSSSDAFGIAAIVDREFFGVAKFFGVALEDLNAMRVEGSNGRTRWSGLPAANFLGQFESMADAFLHFHGRFVGERHGQNAIGAGSVFDQVGDTECDDSCLSRSSSCQNQQGTGEGIDCILLRWV